jgi:hypothetical protein
MKRTASLLATIAIALCVSLLTLCAWAQKPIANPGPKYDLTNEVKIKGVVESVKLDERPGEGTHLILKTGVETLLVHVAPEGFLKDLDVSFNKGDQLEIIGSRLKTEEGPEILVKEITRDNNTLTIRDGKGIAVWGNWEPSKK